MSTIPVTIIIPFLNEEKELPLFFEKIKKLTIHPERYLFVDSGAEDASVNIINTFSHPSSQVDVIVNTSGETYFPGKSRNIGIQNSDSEWFAFLDVGVDPHPNWLENIWDYVQENNTMGAVGYCEFSADKLIATTLCVLSNGYKSQAPALPGSIFNRKIIEKVKLFREDLRSCEDVIFREEFLSLYNRPYAKKAIVYYKSYSNSLVEILKKWKLYAYYAARSGLTNKQKNAYHLFFTVLIFLLLFNFKLFTLVLGTFIFLRGIVLPFKRSGSMGWIFKNPLVLFAMPFIVLLLDLAKWLGYLKFDWEKNS